jgi:hypothetical protein
MKYNKVVLTARNTVSSFTVLQCNEMIYLKVISAKIFNEISGCSGT